jgi:hypothetical protein
LRLTVNKLDWLLLNLANASINKFRAAMGLLVVVQWYSPHYFRLIVKHVCKAVTVGSSRKYFCGRSITWTPCSKLFFNHRIVCAYVNFVNNGSVFFCVGNRMNQSGIPPKIMVFLWGKRLDPPRAGMITIFLIISSRLCLIIFSGLPIIYFLFYSI